MDRDGTVNAGIPKHERVDSVEKVEILPKVLQALEELTRLEYGVFFITNQAGIAEGLITEAEFEIINNRVIELIAPSGIKILKTYVCPHGENSDCECRKPKPKLIFDASKEFDIDLTESWMVGDRQSDIMTGVNAGTKTILAQTGILSVTSDEATYIAPNLLAAVNYIATH